MSITQGYRGSLNLAATPIRMPVLPGSSISMPKNYQFPPIAHNAAWAHLYAEGLQVPVAQIQAPVTPAWFTAANLNAWFLARDLDASPGPMDDLAVIAGPSGDTDYGLKLFDGATGVKMKNVKGNTFMLGSSQGQVLTARMVFMGTEIAAQGTTTYAITTDNPLNWARVSFTGITDVVQWQLMIGNNDIPNPVHNGTVHPTEINATAPTASLRLTLPAGSTAPVNGTPIGIAILVTSPSTSVTFTCNNPLVLAPDERAIQTSPAFRQYDLNLLGGMTTGAGAAAEVPGVTIA